MLFSFFMPKKKLDERLDMRMSEILELVSKKSTPSHVTSLVMDACVDTRDREDVEVPYLNIKIR